MTSFFQDANQSKQSTIYQQYQGYNTTKGVDPFQMAPKVVSISMKNQMPQLKYDPFQPIRKMGTITVPPGSSSQSHQIKVFNSGHQINSQPPQQQQLSQAPQQWNQQPSPPVQQYQQSLQQQTLMQQQQPIQQQQIVQQPQQTVQIPPMQQPQIQQPVVIQPPQIIVQQPQDSNNQMLLQQLIANLQQNQNQQNNQLITQLTTLLSQSITQSKVSTNQVQPDPNIQREAELIKEIEKYQNFVEVNNKQLHQSNSKQEDLSQRLSIVKQQADESFTQISEQKKQQKQKQVCLDSSQEASSPQIQIRHESIERYSNPAKTQQYQPEVKDYNAVLSQINDQKVQLDEQLYKLNTLQQASAHQQDLVKATVMEQQLTQQAMKQQQQQISHHKILQDMRPAFQPINYNPQPQQIQQTTYPVQQQKVMPVNQVLQQSVRVPIQQGPQYQNQQNYQPSVQQTYQNKPLNPVQSVTSTYPSQTQQARQYNTVAPNLMNSNPSYTSAGVITQIPQQSIQNQPPVVSSSMRGQQPSYDRSTSQSKYQQKVNQLRNSQRHSK